jgi:Arc/MetJ family transcription regulator
MPYAMAQEVVTRTTLVLDDTPVAKTEALVGMEEKSALVREALDALIERESAHRLARLGGSEAHLEAAPRRHAGAA